MNAISPGLLNSLSPILHPLLFRLIGEFRDVAQVARSTQRQDQLNDKINCLITDYPERAGLLGSLLVAAGFIVAHYAGDYEPSILQANLHSAPTSCRRDGPNMFWLLG
jgi:hypothetical protein